MGTPGSSVSADPGGDYGSVTGQRGAEGSRHYCGQRDNITGVRLQKGLEGLETSPGLPLTRVSRGPRLSWGHLPQGSWKGSDYQCLAWHFGVCLGGRWLALVQAAGISVGWGVLTRKGCGCAF